MLESHFIEECDKSSRINVFAACLGDHLLCFVFTPQSNIFSRKISINKSIVSSVA